MPISYTIDKQRKLVLTKATGILTDADLYNHKRALMTDPDFEPGMRELSDVRAVEELRVTPSGVWSLMAIDKEHEDKLKTFKLAIVVSGDSTFGMARMYQAVTEQTMPNVGVFRNDVEAKEWLGIPKLITQYPINS